MRARASKDGLTVRVIAGTHAALLAFDLADERRAGCLGFSIERTDVGTGDRRWLPNSLRFMIDPNPEWVTTARTPLRSSAGATTPPNPGGCIATGSSPATGPRPRSWPRASWPSVLGGFDAIPGGVALELRTEDCRNEATSIFFNRGAAASQAYVSKFGDNDPDDIPEALTWLSRGLEEGLRGLHRQGRRARLRPARLHLRVREADADPGADRSPEARRRGAHRLPRPQGGQHGARRTITPSKAWASTSRRRRAPRARRSCTTSTWCC